MQAGRDLAFAPRGQAQLAQFVAQDIPEIDVKAAGGGPAPSDSKAPDSKAPDGKAPAAAKDGGDAKKKTGCGCQSGGDGAGGALLLLGAAALLGTRRWPNRRSSR